MDNAILNFDSKNYIFQTGEHRNRKVTWISFPYDQNLVKQLKENTKARWSSSQKKWYVPDNSFYRALFGLEAKRIGKRALNHIHPVNQLAFQKFIEQLQLKGYSQNTIRSYSVEFAQLLKTIKLFPVDQLSTEKLRSYFCIALII